MTYKNILVSNLKPYIGFYVEFEFYFDCNDAQIIRGYLQGLSRHTSGYTEYLHISSKPELPSGLEAQDLGGYAMDYVESVYVLLPS